MATLAWVLHVLTAYIFSGVFVDGLLLTATLSSFPRGLAECLSGAVGRA